MAPVTYSHFPMAAGGPVRGQAGRSAGFHANTSATGGEGPLFPSGQAEQVWDSHLVCSLCPGELGRLSAPTRFEPGRFHGAPFICSPAMGFFAHGPPPPSLQTDPLPRDPGASGSFCVWAFPVVTLPCVSPPCFKVGMWSFPHFRAAGVCPFSVCPRHHTL